MIGLNTKANPASITLNETYTCLKGTKMVIIIVLYIFLFEIVSNFSIILTWKMDLLQLSFIAAQA